MVIWYYDYMRTVLLLHYIVVVQYNVVCLYLETYKIGIIIFTIYE